MLKLGTYGFLRFAMPLFPAASHRLGADARACIAVIGIIYGALCAWEQDDVKKLVAYSLGQPPRLRDARPLQRHDQRASSGAILQMVNHGISTGALFLLVGVIYDRRHTRLLADFGGLAKVMPVYARAVRDRRDELGRAARHERLRRRVHDPHRARSCRGTLGSQRADLQARRRALGVILAAVYMLHAVQKMFLGPLDKPENQGLPDLTRRELLALAPLIVLVFVIGFFPNVVPDAHEHARSTRCARELQRASCAASDHERRTAAACSSQRAAARAPPSAAPQAAEEP